MPGGQGPPRRPPSPPFRTGSYQEASYLGFYYRERFATKSHNLSWIRSADVSSLERASELSSSPKTEKPSIHRRAIANGLVEILSVYRPTVLQIEQKLLFEIMPILATVTQVLNKACIQRLLWHGHQVLYNQLASWMVYGILQQDQHGEFFTRRVVCVSFDDTSLTDWHLGFHIFLDMMPEYIHMRVAKSILFAGKAIRVLRNPSPAFQFQDALYNQHIKKGFQKVYGSVGCVPIQKKQFLDVKVIGEKLLPQSEAEKIEVMLQDLKESSEFQKRSFECLVDSIRAVAASHLWQLMCRLDHGHLKALKDYFLLAKGDFFQCFLKESQQLMRLPPYQSTAEADLMVPFLLAAIKIISEEDKYFSRVSLRYRRIFQYLLRLERTQMELEKSWASAMHHDHTDFAKHRNERMNCSTSQPRRRRFRPMWPVREHMAFLIRNLQFYIQFCWNIENQESSQNTSQLERITEEFNKKSNSLYTILRSSRLAGSRRAPFLRRFLLRINFNSFFEATARGVLNVVRPRPSLNKK
ncbi:hypothetical protein PTKIN_Ptkin12aG0136500 [Pterospermum kingtungense]